MTDAPEAGPALPFWLRAGVLGRCPRCDAPTLFAGQISFAPRCRSCELDFDGFNVGDGPAAFLILIIGAIVVGGVVWMQLALAPPPWVLAVVWLPIALFLIAAGLRLSKGALLAIEHRRQAREGQIDANGDLGDER